MCPSWSDTESAAARYSSRSPLLIWTRSATGFWPTLRASRRSGRGPGSTFWHATFLDGACHEPTVAVVALTRYASILDGVDPPSPAVEWVNRAAALVPIAPMALKVEVKPRCSFTPDSRPAIWLDSRWRHRRMFHRFQCSGVHA